MNSVRVVTSATQTFRKQNLRDRSELAPPLTGPQSVDHRILTHAGPIRSPKVIRRAKPYSNRSPSPDPRFGPSSTVSPSPPPSPSRPTTSSNHRAPSKFKVCIPRRAHHIGASQHGVPVLDNSPPRTSLISETQVVGQDTTTSSSSRHAAQSDIHFPQALQIRHTHSRNPATQTSSMLKPQLAEDEGSDTDDYVKIPKPPGEVSRPGRGGYNLRAVLEWSNERFLKVKRFIDTTVEDKLDCLQPLTKQSPANVEEALQKFYFLSEYRDNWVIDDFIKCHLKYLKQALQKKAMKTAVAEARQEAQRATLRAELAEKKAAVARDSRQRGDHHP
ncbi:hypothetical protein F5879DRAFT_995561 [Lentinula edodes]|nr:hypothetical protein F5879DRAFT_995561 [Lentinula edodes]KAJ3911797.1 hypothetical protein F5877DRAFT_85536 [Lentinula edodes]